MSVTSRALAAALPDPAALLDRSRAPAMLDAILSPGWEPRYYSFNARWAPGEQMASMGDGSGGEYSMVFSAAGVFLRGFDHESSMTPYARGGELFPGLLEGLPPALQCFADEPAFAIPGDQGGLSATTVVWREQGDDRWRAGSSEDPPGDDQHWLFDLLLDPDPVSACTAFAGYYYEVEVERSAVASVFALQPLTGELIRGLNAELTLVDLSQDIAEIGYLAGS